MGSVQLLYSNGAWQCGGLASSASAPPACGAAPSSARAASRAAALAAATWQGRSDQEPLWSAADRNSLVKRFAEKRYASQPSDLAVQRLRLGPGTSHVPLPHLSALYAATKA